MGSPNATLEAAAVAVTALGNRISLHTADPGTTGASEAAGGSYARVATVWAAGGSDGAVTGSPVLINAAAGTYAGFGVWTPGGAFVGGELFDDPVVLDEAGQIRVTPTYTQTNAA